jgi:site-specific DNA-methyltransferase (adenine-specific)
VGGVTEGAGVPTAAHDTALGTLLHGDSIAWLRTLAPRSVRLVVADPPYGVKKAEWDTFASREAYVAWSRGWLAEVSRVLTDDGSAYVMGYSEVLADVKWAAGDGFSGCRWLVWHYRNKANLRNDWGRSHESILHLRKGRAFVFHVDAVRIPYNEHTRRYPARKQGSTSAFEAGRGSTWSPHPSGAKPRDVLEIPILNNGMDEKTPHPTQKPLELVRRLVLASSDPGDLVVDPFSGSGTTAVICELTGRRWLACDREAEYVGYARARLAAVASGALRLEDLARSEEAMRRNRGKVRGGDR